jgi:hypothetical protein
MFVTFSLAVVFAAIDQIKHSLAVLRAAQLLPLALANTLRQLFCLSCFDSQSYLLPFGKVHIVAIPLAGFPVAVFVTTSRNKNAPWPCWWSSFHSYTVAITFAVFPLAVVFVATVSK